MLECIKFGDYKLKIMQIGSEWFVAEGHIGDALVVSSHTLKSIVLNLLHQQNKFSKGVLVSLRMAPSCSLQYL